MGKKKSKKDAKDAPPAPEPVGGPVDPSVFASVLSVSLSL